MWLNMSLTTDTVDIWHLFQSGFTLIKRKKQNNNNLTALFWKPNAQTLFANLELENIANIIVLNSDNWSFATTVRSYENS